MNETIKAKIGKGEDAPSASVTIDLDALFEKVGADVERRQAKVATRVDIQAIIRSGMKGKKSAKDMQKEVDAYTPGEKRRSMSKAERLTKEFEKLSPEDRASALAALSVS